MSQENGSKSQTSSLVDLNDRIVNVLMNLDNRLLHVRTVASDISALVYTAYTVFIIVFAMVVSAIVSISSGIGIGAIAGGFALMFLSLGYLVLVMFMEPWNECDCDACKKRG